MKQKKEIQDRGQARKGEEEMVKWSGGEVRREGTMDQRPGTRD